MGTLRGKTDGTVIGSFRWLGSLGSHLSNGLFFPISLAVSFGVFALRLLLLPVERQVDIDVPVRFAQLVAALPVVIVAHELSHGLAGRYWAGIPWQRISFGMAWRQLLPYCATRGTLTVWQERRMLVAPLIVTTIVFTILMAIWPSLYLVVLFALGLSGCSADVVHWVRLRRFRPDDRLPEQRDDEDDKPVIRPHAVP